MLSRLIDAVIAAPDIDKSRVAIYGGSFGGYWSTMLAATERDRVKAVVAQSPPIHETFSAEALERAMSNKEYLFDYIPAYLSVYAEVETLDDLRAARAKASLQAQGILARPMAPMLVIGASTTRRCRSPTSTCCCTAARRRRKRGSTPPAAIWGARPRAGPTRRSSSASPCRGCCARSK